MCYNIGGNLIAVLITFCGMAVTDSWPVMPVVPPFPWLGLCSCCRLSALSHVVCIYCHFLTYTAPLYSRPLSLSLESAVITKDVRGFGMWGNWNNALQFTTWGKFFPSKSNIFFQGDTLYLSLSFSTHIAQHDIPILVLKMSHSTGQAGTGYVVRASNLQTSVALAAMPFSAGLWIPRSPPGVSFLVMAPSKIPLSRYRDRRK